MVAKVALYICAQALVLQCIAGQYCNAGWSWQTAPAIAASHSSSLPIASSSPLPPNGVALQSENSYAGDLSICGGLPFLGTVGLEGHLPTSGYSAVQYGCGNGEVGILSENAATSYAAPRGCGCGRAAYY